MSKLDIDHNLEVLKSTQRNLKAAFGFHSIVIVAFMTLSISSYYQQGTEVQIIAYLIYFRTL